MSKPKFYTTTAIPYANGAPHIGHAYERIATDAIARFKRLDGYDVLFVTGMDEHGQKMQQTAAREGLTAMALADRTAKQFEDMGEELNARADDILRTTSERHRISVQDVWRRMAAKGDIYLSKYSGWYSVRDEAFYGEDETEERDGRRFAVKTGTPVEWVEEESYFFRLSAYAERLLRLYEERPDFIVPENYKNEIVAFVKRGLNDLSISRTTFDWGIPVPGDPKHVMYVWVDALTNYLSATGFPDANAPRAGFWPADAHVIGKDITRFHAIYWPAFLMSAGLPVPKQIVVHGFLFSRGEKMSKSVGNVVSPTDLVRSYGVDQTRYFFLREVPFGQDGNYSHEAIVNRINADLANDLGNLAQR
ncbi:MAG: methionine--tRNA ligase, partial [Alphaproteobacteria bacterium]|nr:methionine--tRNA ligase [Alphaproteobacteria bacterium]